MKQKLLRIIFIQSLIATLWSLYYGYFGDPVINITTGQLFNPLNGLTPCELCRYARILVYPIVFISGIWLLHRAYQSTISYILPLSILGIWLEIYHYSLQKFSISTQFTCTYANPCNALEVNYLGFITIPFLCLIACVVICTASILIYRQRHHHN